MTIGYQSKKFSEYIDNLNKKYKINIEIFLEDKPLGECGALWDIKK